MAQKAGALIVPVGAFTRHGYRLNRWDQYIVPYPYARIAIHLGQPMHVSHAEETEAAVAELSNRLHRVSGQAIADYYSA